MKTSTLSKRKGFTLIELLASVAIIAILAGVSIAGLNYFTAKSSEQAAATEHNLIGEAIEAYRSDNQVYPPMTYNEEAVGDKAKNYPRAPFAIQAKGDDSSAALVWHLGGQRRSDSDKINSTVYLDQLVDNADGSDSLVNRLTTPPHIEDAFGNPFAYRIRNERNTFNTVNPDYDLWSAGPNGKDFNPNQNVTDQNPDDDIVNW